ncbi:MAG: hypothetical protein HY399_00775 [Elusimicrobia bacterium]|nr:hypothetical protein [Elusimicrobiota bacterium]
MNRWKREWFLQKGMEGIVVFLSISGFAFVLLFFLDLWFLLSHGIRIILFILACVGVGSVAGKYMVALFRFSTRDLFSRILICYPDLVFYLPTAWEIKQRGIVQGVSEELAQAHLVQTEEKLKGLPAEPVFPWRPSPQVRQRFLASVLLGGLGSPWMWGHRAELGRVLNPWKESLLEEWVESQPGTVRVPWGASPQIQARWKEGARGVVADRWAALELWVKQPSLSWRNVPWDSGAPGHFVFQLQDLTTPLEYQIRFKDLRTQSYTLIPVPYPHLRQVRIHVTPPGYTRRPPEVLEGLQDVQGLSGGWVEVAGEPDRPLRSARLKLSTQEEPIPFKSTDWRGGIKAGFPMPTEGSFTLELTDQEGISDPHPPEFHFRVIPDQFPEATLLSPSFDVEVSPEESLPIAYEVRDDFGVGRVELVYRTDSGLKGFVPIEKFPNPPEHFVGDYSWNLKSFPLGSTLEFRLRALDNHLLNYQEGISQAVKVRLVDFEKQHQVSELGLLSLEKQVASLDRKEEELLSVLRKDSLSGAETDRFLRELQEAWSKVSEESRQLSKSLEEDPYLNPGLLEQMKDMAASLQSLNQEKVPPALDALRHRKLEESRRLHEHLSRALKGAAEKLKQGLKSQLLQDFLGEAQKAQSRGRELSSALSKLKESPAPSDQAWQEMAKLLQEIQQKLADLSQNLNALPRPAPGSVEEKQRKVIRIPMGSAQSLSQALARALENHDLARALEIAKQLTEELSKLERALEEAGQAESQNAQDQKLQSEKLSKLQESWQQVVEEQTGQVEQVNRLQEEEAQAKLKFQEELLARLETQQRKALQEARGIASVVSAGVTFRMQEVLDAFTRRQAADSPVLLMSIIESLEALSRTQEPSSTPIREVQTQEKQILSELKKAFENSPPSSSGIKQKSGAASTQQQAIRSKTGGLKSQAEELDPSLLPDAVGKSLSEAQKEMSGAEESLQVPQLSEASQRSSRALDKLEQGLQKLGQALDRQRQIEKQMAGPSPRRGGMTRPMGGMRGAQIAPVRLPSPEEYRPSEEMRKEILESLQEKLPKSQEKSIKEYLKRISQ